jgi:hypothetical protein
MTDTHEQTQTVPIPDEEPITGHAVLVAIFSAGAAALLATATRRRSHRLGAGDMLLAAVASQRLARLVTKDRVTSGLRAPFARRRPDDETLPGEVGDSPAGTGMRLAVGQLLTCPYCTAQWAALGFVGGFTLAPRQTRLVAATLAITSAADLFQAGYVRAVAAGSG